MIEQSEHKKMAAEYAVRYLKDGMIIGLGSGTTADFFLQRLSELIQKKELTNIVGIPSSVETAKRAQELDIPLTIFEKHPKIDITIDGADEVNPQLQLIKGGGGALLREKILAQNSSQNVIVIDETKLVAKLGEKHPIPVEVLPFAWYAETIYLESLGATTKIRQNLDGSTYKTDQDNIILDCQFNEIFHLNNLSDQLNQRAGIIGHGLFLNMADLVIVAGEKGVMEIKREKSGASLKQSL